MSNRTWVVMTHAAVCLCADGGLMSKDPLPAQSTTLEALLRGEGLDKRNNSKNDEESLLEIQVGSRLKRRIRAPTFRVCASGVLCPNWLSRQLDPRGPVTARRLWTASL